jgi:hypothetical protein
MVLKLIFSLPQFRPKGGRTRRLSFQSLFSRRIPFCPYDEKWREKREAIETASLFFTTTVKEDKPNNELFSCPLRRLSQGLTRLTRVSALPLDLSGSILHYFSTA